MHITTVAMLVIVPMALLTSASPVVEFGTRLSVRDSQPLCENGKHAGCGDGEVYRTPEDCKQSCYGVSTYIRSHCPISMF